MFKSKKVWIIFLSFFIYIKYMFGPNILKYMYLPSGALHTLHQYFLIMFAIYFQNKDGQCVDILFEMQDDFDTKFEALKVFTLTTLGNEKKRNDELEKQLLTFE